MSHRLVIWIGTIEVRPQSETSEPELLEGAKGAFVEVVTWAADAEQYKQKTELLVESLGALVVTDVLNAEPVDDRRARTARDFDENTEDLISRARDNPAAILYGTFHLYERDDA